MTATVMLALAAVLLLVQAASLIPGLPVVGSSRRQRRTFTGSQVERVVLWLDPARKAGCWLLIGPAQHQRTCRLPVYRDGLCRWHAAFAAKVAA